MNDDVLPANRLYGFEVEITDVGYEDHWQIDVKSSAWVDVSRPSSVNRLTGETYWTRGRSFRGVTETQLREAQEWAAGILARLAWRAQFEILELGKECECRGEICGVGSSEQPGYVGWRAADEEPSTWVTVSRRTRKPMQAWLGRVLEALVDPNADEPDRLAGASP